MVYITDKKDINKIRILENINFLNIFSHLFLNVHIFITSACMSIRFKPVIDNIQVEGTVSQIVYIGSSLYFIMKNGKLLVIIFHYFFLHYLTFHKMQTRT